MSSRHRNGCGSGYSNRRTPSWNTAEKCVLFRHARLLHLIKLFVCWSFVVHVLPVSSWRARYQLTKPCGQVKEKICDVALKPTWSGSGGDWWHKNLLSPGWKSCVRASTPPSGLRPSWHLHVLESLASSPVGDGFSSGAFNPWCQRVPCVSVSDERGMRTGRPLCDSAERWQQLNQVFACFWQPLWFAELEEFFKVFQKVPFRTSTQSSHLMHVKISIVMQV